MRPAARARRLADPPATDLSATLLALCATGEHAVTVIRPADGPPRAALGSPADAEAYAVWRCEGVYVFLAGDLPTSLSLALGPAGTVTVSVA